MKQAAAELHRLGVPLPHEGVDVIGLFYPDVLKVRAVETNGQAEILTVPGEIYPELVNGGITRYAGADFANAPFEPTLRPQLKSRCQFIFGLANDEIGYIIPKAEWDNQPPWLLHKPEQWYGEVNSVGPEAAGIVTQTLVSLIQNR